MPGWTAETTTGPPGVFDGNVFDSVTPVFDTRFAFEPDSGTSGSWTPGSAPGGSWTPDAALEPCR